MFGADAPWHWAIVIILAMALFGYKKLPDASRSLARSLRIFRTEMKGLSDDIKGPEAVAAPAVAVAADAPAEPVAHSVAE